MQGSRQIFDPEFQVYQVRLVRGKIRFCAAMFGTISSVQWSSRGLFLFRVDHGIFRIEKADHTPCWEKIVMLFSAIW